MTKPSKPTELVGSWSDGAVELTWKAPAETGIKHYVVKSGSTSGNLSDVGPFTQTSAKISIDAGNSGKTIYFAVAAKADELGDFSDPASVSIPPIVPPQEIGSLTWAAALAATAILVVLVKVFAIDSLLPGKSSFEVDLGDIKDTAAAAYGHQLLMIIAEVGVQMIGWGIALLIAVFVPAAVAAAFASVKLRQQRPDLRGAFPMPGLPDVPAFLKAVGDMLRTPAGFGGLLVALGTALLLIGLFSPAAGAPATTPAPSMSPAASASPDALTEPPSESVSPEPSPTPEPTATLEPPTTPGPSPSG